MSDYKKDENRKDLLKSKYELRDVVIHAVRGEILLKKGPDGTPIYRKATPGECKRAALEAFDNIAHVALSKAQAGTAMERLFEVVTGKTMETDFAQELKELIDEEKQKDKEIDSSVRNA